MNEGLPQSSVNDILQSKEGYLWLATFGGLVRFDGNEFTVFDRSNTDGMRSDRILTLFEDRSGALWCGTEEGLLRFRHGTFTTYIIEENGVIYSPLMVKEDARGTIWISVNSKPYRFTDSGFVRVVPIQDPVLAVKAVTEPGGIWMAHDREVLHSLGDSIVLVNDLSKTLSHNIQDIEEFPAGSGTLWLPTNGDGLVQYSGNSIRKFSEADGLPSRYLARVYVDHSNTLWALGFNGISRWTGERFVPLRTIDGGADKEFNVMLQDVEGNYWTGTPANGLFRLRPSVIRTIGPADGLMEGKMLSLTRRKDGSLLFGTNCGGVYEWRNGRAEYSTLNKYLVNLCVWSVLEDSRGRVWTGSRQLTRFDDVKKRGVVYDSSNGFNGLDIFALFEDSKRVLWIGCLNGLFRFDGEQFTHFTMNDGLVHNEVRSIFEDASGTVWIGTANGVCQYRNGSISPVRLEPEDSAAAPLRSRYVRAIHQDAEGTMWFGTYGGGIVRLKNGRTSVITTKEGLFDNIISHIVEDERGYFWMGCNRGLFCVSKKDLNTAADDLGTMVHSSVFGTSDGMNSSETNGGFQPSIAKDTSGNLYVPTVNGVVIVATRKVVKNRRAPSVVIERIITEHGIFSPDSSISLSYDNSSMQIEYAALSFSDPNKVRFKYRMIDYDHEWTDAGNRRMAYFTNIPPGTHTFQVIAANNDGVWNMDGATFQLTVLPPYWMTWWFRSLIVFLFLVSGPSVYYIRVTQLQNEKKEQLRFAEQLIESQERERRRIAMDLHDGLGQQILIIKNRVDMALKSVANPEAITAQLREIVVSTQSSLNDVRAISHGLRPVHLEQFGLRETLLHLCDQVRQTSSLECVHHVDDIDGLIPSDQEINFFRIIQEGINNILKHSGATQASFMIRRSESDITASLWDNGKGFDISGAREGLGLTGIRERTKILGGTCEVKSQPGEGTTILITLPMKKI